MLFFETKMKKLDFFHSFVVKMTVKENLLLLECKSSVFVEP